MQMHSDLINRHMKWLSQSWLKSITIISLSALSFLASSLPCVRLTGLIFLHPQRLRSVWEQNRIAFVRRATWLTQRLPHPLQGSDYLSLGCTVLLGLMFYKDSCGNNKVLKNSLLRMATTLSPSVFIYYPPGIICLLLPPHILFNIMKMLKSFTVSLTGCSVYYLS